MSVLDYEDDLDMDEVELEDVKPDKDNTFYVSQVKTPTHIIEQIATGTTRTTLSPDGKGDYKFIIYNKKTGKTKESDRYKIGKYTYKPLEAELVDKQSIYLASGVENYGSTDDLMEEIKEYLDFYFEVDSVMQKMLPNYVLFTWVFEKFPFIPYLQFLGRTGTGKTTAAETVASICYKAIDATGAASQAAIFRVTDDWGGTIFMDEFNIENSSADSRQGMLSFLKSGVSDRAILRVEAVGKKFNVKPYKVKAPKIFTSEEPITDAGLQSRTISIKMQKNTRKLPLYKLNNYYEKGQELRNKLLLWRLHNIDNINLEEIEHGFEELQFVDRRVQQIITPIYYLSSDKGREQIIKFAEEQEEKTKEERRSTEDGMIFNYIYEYYINNKQEPSLKGITEKVNEQREEMGYKTKRTERKIGVTVREILGFEIKRMGTDNISTIMIEDNINKFDELKEYYGVGSGDSVVRVVSVDNVKKTGTNEGNSVKSEIDDDVINELFGNED